MDNCHRDYYPGFYKLLRSIGDNMDTASLELARMGQFGLVRESGTTAVTGNFWKLVVTGAATFTLLTIANSSGDAMTGFAFPVGTEIMGKITAFTLSGGSVIAYKAPN